jgi:hypothetical protein
MPDTIRTQAELLSFLHPNIPNAAPDATVLQAQAARDLIVSIPTLFGPSGGRLELGTGSLPAPRPNWFGVYDGSVAAPVTTPTPTSMITRIEAVSSTPNAFDPVYNAGLYVALVSLPGNVVQPTAIASYARGDSGTDSRSYVLGGSFTASQFSGPGGAMGVFALAQANPGSTGTDSVVGINPTVYLLNGINYAWPLLTFGVDVDIETGGALNYGSAGVGVRTGGGARWDVGYGILPGAGIRTAGFEDDSNSPTVFKVAGAHTNGFDPSGATFSGSPFVFPGAQAYTPSVGSSAGGVPASYTVSARWLRFGKFIWVQATILITTAAPATAYIGLTLPPGIQAASTQAVPGREIAVAGLGLVALCAGGDTHLYLYLDNNGVTAVNGYNMSFSGFIEVI